jgi:methoxymalonate biosynthesis acyl carrier protein
MRVTMSDVHVKLKEFLRRYMNDYDLGADEDIFALGFVNSMFAMQLVLFIEQEFGISVDDEDLEIENFQTINRIAQLVERKPHGLAS